MVLIDGAVAEPEVIDAKDGQNAEDPNAGPQPAEITDPNHVPEAGADGKGAGEHQEGVEEDEAQTVEQRIAAQEETIKALTEKLEGLTKKPEPEVKAPQMVTLEQAEKFVEEQGLELSPKAFMFFENRLRNTVAGLVNHFNGLMATEMSGSKMDKAIAAMSRDPKYKGIQGMRGHIDEFMDDYNEADRHNQKLLHKAYIYALGMGAGGASKRAATRTEGIKRVIKSTGLAPARKTTGGRGVNLNLSPQERAAYESFGKSTGMTEKEYAESLPRNRGK